MRVGARWISQDLGRMQESNPQGQDILLDSTILTFDMCCLAVVVNANHLGFGIGYFQ